jgi:hypothetical protein
MTFVIPIAIGLLATAVRVLSSPDLSNDHYMHMAWAQQLLFGDLPGRDFVDPGMPLAYVLSAAVQALRPGPFSELAFSGIMLGVAAGVTCAVARRVTGSWLIAIGVSLLEIGFQPRFYSYPKILVPAVTLLLLQRYFETRSTSRLAWLGVWSGAAVLLRHDFAIYIAAAMICALPVMFWGAWKQLFEASWKFAAATLLTLLPYLTYVQWSEGIREHLRRGIEFARADEHQRSFELPHFEAMAAGWTRANAVAFLFYAAHALVLVLVGLLIARRRDARERLAGTAGALGILAGYLLVILRYPVDQRLPDMASVFAICLAATAALIVTTIRARPSGRLWRALVLGGGGVCGAAALVASVWVIGQVPEMIDKTGIYAGMRGLRETYAQRRARDLTWPWEGAWPTSEFPPAVAYIAACTEPDDALLLTWRAPEYNFFARRKFAAGHAEFLAPRAFTSVDDQAQMLKWLSAQRVPIVLVNLTEEAQFARSYAIIDAYLKGNYATVGRFKIYDGSDIAVAVRNGLQPARTWGPDDWPCSFSAAAE